MHELKQLVDDCLQELPVSSQKPWVLTYYVHYVGCNNGFVVFSSLLFTESQEILQQSTFLRFLSQVCPVQFKALQV